MSLQGVEPPQGFSNRALNSGGGFPRIQLIPPQGIGIAGGVIPADWFNLDWLRRLPFIVNNGRVFPAAGSQTDFPYLFSSTVTDFIGNTEPNGEDFRFVLPNKDELKYEIQSYNNLTGELIAWSKDPLVFDGQKIYLYFKNPGVADNQDPPNVYDTDYAGVWHMNSAIPATDLLLDSTDNDNDGNPQGGGAGLTQVNGKIGKAINFTGEPTLNNSHYRVPMGTAGASNKLNIHLGKTNEITIQGWLKFTVAIQESNFWVSHPNNTTAWELAGNLAQYFSRQQFPKMELITHGNVSENSLFINTNSDIVAAVFKHFVFTYKSVGQISTWYIDGVIDNTSNTTAATWQDTTGNVDLFISRNQAVGIPFTDDMGFNGVIDELRISQIARTSDWIKTEFFNQNDPDTPTTGFYRLEPVQSIPAQINFMIDENGNFYVDKNDNFYIY